MARAAETAIIDDVSKTDRSCRADSALSCAHTLADRVPRGKTLGRQATRFRPNRLPFLAESRHVQRRCVDRRGQPGRRPFQAVQHLIDAREFCVLFEQTLRFECIGDFRNQVPAHAAHIRKRREHPDRRRAKGHDAQHFDRVARGAPGEKIVGQRSFGAVNAFDSADLLDEEPERRIHEVRDTAGCGGCLPEGRPLPLHASHRRRTRSGSDDSLGEGDQIGFDGHHRP